MRVRVDNYLQFLKKNQNKYNIIFLYGYNDGLVNLLFRDTIKILGVDENNPFLVSKIEANELKENPSILSDNLSTISIFEEKRFVLLNLLYFTFSKATEKIIIDNLNHPQNDNFVLIIKAGNLSSQSSLIRHLQTSNNCILIPCYEDEPNNIKIKITMRQKMKRATAITALAVIVLIACGVTRAAEEKPNIIFFLVND